MLSAVVVLLPLFTLFALLLLFCCCFAVVGELYRVGDVGARHSDQRISDPRTAREKRAVGVRQSSGVPPGDCNCVCCARGTVVV